ncbi:MAG: hypothetical protein KDB21_12310 [Acidimicrobiales bacterium]|nr:hypothetical protein [Acidimicrobiales bacterium]
METHTDRRIGRFDSRLRHLLAALAVTAVVAGCGSSESGQVVAGPGDLGHVHDLTIDADGMVLVASHTGLWRIEATDRAVLVGSERHDLMAMTALDDGTLLVSGHPDLRLEEYHVEDHPPFFGLTESRDGGQTWEVVDLLGEADFHALVALPDRLYAAETAGRIWRRDADGSWEQLGELEARDLAVDPSDPDRLVGTDWDGRLWVSDDGAVSWEAVSDAPAMTEVEWLGSGGLVGVAEDGAIFTATDPAGPWADHRSAPGEVETLHVEGDTWWVTTHGDNIATSTDEGASWTDVYKATASP